MASAYRSRFFLILIAVIVLPASPLLKGQSSRGAILGTVRDPAGALVPGAKVSVANQATNISFEYETDTTGNYYVPSLIPGRYRIAVEKAGFKKFTANDVIVEVDQAVRVDIRMELGQVTEVVEVREAAPMVQTDTTTLGQVVRDRQVLELPLNGRDFQNLIKLNVGVSEMQGGIITGIRRHGLNDNFRSYSVNGSRPASLSYLIDGVTGNDSLFQGLSVVPPIDSIQEFKLQNGLYSAEYGMGAAQVNVALKSGTNALHGSLWEFLRNAALQRKHPFFHTKDPLKQNQFGGTLGGPVWIPGIYKGKDRTFFFGSYEVGRRRSGSFGTAQLPTAQQKQGDFSDWPVQLYNPLTGVFNSDGTVTRQPFPNNRIPDSLIAQTSKNLLQHFPSPNVNCKLPCPNFIRSFPSGAIDTDAFTVRMDHKVTTRDRIFGQFVYEDQLAPSPSVIPLSGTKVEQNGRLAGLQWTHFFGPRTINEARMGFNRIFYLNSFETAFGGVNYWGQVGFKNLRDDASYYALPAVTLGTNYNGIGNGGSIPFFNITNIFHYVDNVSITRGRHTMKAGADIRRNQNMNINGFGGNGLVNFTGQYTAQNPLAAQVAGRPGTGNAFADFLLGYMSGSPSIRFTAFDQSFSRLRNTDFMFFFQDDFRLSPQLTLNLGLRWELHTPFHDKTGGGFIFDFGFPGGRKLYIDRGFVDAANNPIFASCCAPDTLINTDKRDFAPRIGLAWRPFAGSNKFVVRAGYGISYDVLHNFYPTQTVAQNIPFLSPTLPQPTGLENSPPLDIRNMFPAPYSISSRKFPSPYCQAPSRDIIDPTTGVITQTVNQCFGLQTQLPDNKTPYIQQWALNLQYEFRPNVLLEVGYEGSHALREPIQWIFNQASLPSEIGNPNNMVRFRSQCPAGQPCSPTQDRVPYPNFTQTGFANAYILQSVHHALTVKVDKRFSEGLTGLVLFTWGRTIDQFSETQAVGGSVSSIAQYSHRFDLERGPANFDQTRRLVTSWLYEFPFGKGKKLLNRGGIVDRVVGGWQANGIVTLTDGFPFTVGCFCGDRAEIGNTFNVERPNLTGNPLPSGFNQNLGGPGTKGWFDTSVFSLPPLGTLGTAGRNILRSTAQRATDFSVFKNNRITERVNLQFRAEFFNLLSSEFYFPRTPNNNFSSSDFGSFISKSLTTDGRPVQDTGVLFSPRIIQFGLRLTF